MSVPSHRFTSILAACDDLMAAGVRFEDADLQAVPENLRDRVASGLHCLHALNQLLHQTKVANLTVQSAMLSAGTSFGRFHVQRVLGQGGFGTVYLAVDPTLNRQVALKVPHMPGLLDETARLRFEAEARTAALLDHPHIVTVYESGTVGSISYIISAYCPGCTLSEWRRAQPKGALPWDDIARLLAQLAEAVQHAHSRGVLHRDLKPANILLMPSGDNSPEADLTRLPLQVLVPRITDFGLSKSLLPANDESSRSGVIAGTPNYMAPETASGQTRQVSTATDVYGLGAILYELLTSQPPFSSDTPLNTLDKVRYEPPQDTRQLNPAVPIDLATISARCLRKNPADRYQSAQELEYDLQRYLRREPIQARPVGRWERARLWTRRHPAVAALMALAAMLVMALGAAAIYHVLTMQKTLNELGVALGQVTANVNRAEASRDICLDTIDTLSSLSERSLQYTPQTDPLRQEILAASQLHAERLMKMEPENLRVKRLYAQSKFRHARILERQGHRVSAATMMDEAEQLFQQLLTETSGDRESRLDIASIHIHRGTNSRESSRPGSSAEQLAVMQFTQALDIYEALVAEAPQSRDDRCSLANTHEYIGLLALNRSDLVETRNHYEAAFQLRHALHLEKPNDAAMLGDFALSHLNMGILISFEGRANLSTCGKLWCLALQLDPYATALYQPAYLVLHGIGTANMQHALALMEKAVQMLKETVRQLPGDHRPRRFLCQALRQTAKLEFRDLGGYQRAVQLTAEAIVLNEALVRDYPTVVRYRLDLASLHHEAAVALQYACRLPEAITHLQIASSSYVELAASKQLPAIAHMEHQAVQERLKLYWEELQRQQRKP